MNYSAPCCPFHCLFSTLGRNIYKRFVYKGAYSSVTWSQAKILVQSICTFVIVKLVLNCFPYLIKLYLQVLQPVIQIIEGDQLLTKFNLGQHKTEIQSPAYEHQKKLWPTKVWETITFNICKLMKTSRPKLGP